MEKQTRLFSNHDLWKLILPLVIEQFLTIAVGMADSVMIAGVGEAAVSAVSLVDTVNVLLINLFAALATGGAVIVGQYMGRKRLDRASRATDQLYLFTVAFSLVIMGLLYLGRSFILHRVFGSIAPDVMGFADTYLRIVAASIPFIAIYNCGAAVFRAMGNSKISMISSMIMNAVNIIGNAILIYGLKMEIAGAAIPTLISRIVAAVMITVLLRRQTLPVHLARRPTLRPDLHLIRKILHIGVPNGLENSMFQLGKILLLSLVSGMGTASIAANAIGNTVAQFQILPGMSIGLAMLTVISRCVGAGDYRQARQYTKKLMGVTYAAMVLTNLAVFLLIPMIVQIYALSAETAALTRQILIFHGVCCVVIWPLSFTLPNVLRAANDVRFSMIVATLSMWSCRIGAAYLLAHLGFGLLGVWMAMVLDWICRSACFIVRYLRGRWQENRI